MNIHQRESFLEMVMVVGRQIRREKKGAEQEEGL